MKTILNTSLFVLLCIVVHAQNSTSAGTLIFQSETTAFTKKIEDLDINRRGPHRELARTKDLLIQDTNCGTYSYRGGLIIYDVKQKLKKKIIYPVSYSYNDFNPGIVLRIDNDTISATFLTKGGQDAKEDLLAAPSSEEKYYYRYQLTSSNRGTNWTIKRIENISKEEVDARRKRQ